MSIIHDALKKAQEQRGKNKAGTPYNVQESKKKPPITLIAVALVVVLAVVAYLYVPAFHKPKTLPAVQAKVEQSQPAPVPVSPAIVQSTAEAPQKSGEPIAETRKFEPIAIPVQPRPAVSASPSSTAPAHRERATGDALAAADEPIRRVAVERTQEDRINAMYNDALKELNAGRTREAQRIFLNILSRQPGHVESLNNLGVLSASQGNRDEALAYFRKILEYRKDYPKAYNNIGLIMMSGGDQALAEEYFRTAISLEPDSLEPYMNLSALLRNQGKYTDALNALETPIRKNVRDPYLFLSYAAVKDNLGQHEEAIRYYRQYLALAKQSEARDGVVARLRYLEGKR